MIYFVVIGFLLDTLGMRDTKKYRAFLCAYWNEKVRNKTTNLKNSKNMKTKRLLFAILAVSALVLSGCKDDLTGPTQKKLTKSTWTFEDGDYEDNVVYTLYFKTASTFQVQLSYYEYNKLIYAYDIVYGNYDYDEEDGILYATLYLEGDVIKYKGIFMSKTVLIVSEYDDESRTYIYDGFTFTRK